MTAGGKEEAEGGNMNIEHGDILQALSGAHLREVGIAIKEARPGWQEAHVQVRSMLHIYGSSLWDALDSIVSWTDLWLLWKERVRRGGESFVLVFRILFFVLFWWSGKRFVVWLARVKILSVFGFQLIRCQVGWLCWRLLEGNDVDWLCLTLLLLLMLMLMAIMVETQLVSVLLVIAYLEEGAKNTLPGGKRPDPLRCARSIIQRSLICRRLHLF